ncbi:glycosyltransferase [Pseudomonas baetica]|uniref:glycosyltransferase n=1 Tax=Pseudomonas baetica TaxID=674054 RepID=UPI0024068BB9|nr:hypothetical protein [Pseudomonas baetica]MDF9774453.1 hypothetical protein [Pseudomonas baetica]
MNIFASSSENYTNILLGALASGRPMIYSDVMPIPEFGEDVVLYFTPFDSMNIGDVLTEALSTPELLSKLSSATVCRATDLIGKVSRKRLGLSDWRWPNAQKKVVAR